MVAGDSLSPQEGGGAIWATCRGWGWGQGRVFFVMCPQGTVLALQGTYYVYGIKE